MDKNICIFGTQVAMQDFITHACCGLAHYSSPNLQSKIFVLEHCFHSLLRLNSSPRYQ